MILLSRKASIQNEFKKSRQIIKTTAKAVCKIIISFLFEITCLFWDSGIDNVEEQDDLLEMIDQIDEIIASTSINLFVIQIFVNGHSILTRYLSK